jgi:hypothetical protein
MPVEAVVPALRRVVEQPLVGASRGLDHRLQRLPLEIGPGGQRIGLVDIGLVVLAVVEAQRLGRNRRLERGVGIGQVDERECHDGLPDD